MPIIEQLQFISLALATSFLVVVAQTVVLSRIFRSKAWYLLAGGIVVIGVRQLWSFITLPTQIMRAKEMGMVIPVSLSWTQLIMTGTAFLAVGLLIAGFDRLRRDLQKIGI